MGALGSVPIVVRQYEFDCTYRPPGAPTPWGTQFYNGGSVTYWLEFGGQISTSVTFEQARPRRDVLALPGAGFTLRAVAYPNANADFSHFTVNGITYAGSTSLSISLSGGEEVIAWFQMKSANPPPGGEDPGSCIICP